MLDKMTYVNHLNQRVQFGQDGLYLTDSELYDYDWSYNSSFGEITDFRKEITTKKMKIIISAESEKEGIEQRNRIFEIFEQDVLAEKHGRLYCKDYYLECYIIESKKTNWFLTGSYIELLVTIVTDRPNWILEKKYEFRKVTAQDTEQGQHLKKYPYTYGYFYKNHEPSGTISNDCASMSEFVMRLCGPATNPKVTVGDNVYLVNTIVDAGDYIEIDSAERTIKLIRKNGTEENMYWKADKKSFIFQPIQKGNQKVAWDGKFAWDLLLKSARSEPKW